MVSWLREARLAFCFILPAERDENGGFLKHCCSRYSRLRRTMAHSFANGKLAWISPLTPRARRDRTRQKQV